MNTVQKYKSYYFVLGIILMFLIVITYSLYIYLKWDTPIEDGRSSVEVSLPVIDWDKYSDLSKQY